MGVSPEVVLAPLELVCGAVVGAGAVVAWAGAVVGAGAVVASAAGASASLSCR